jgi:hypothetical protein
VGPNICVRTCNLKFALDIEPPTIPKIVLAVGPVVVVVVVVVVVLMVGFNNNNNNNNNNNGI